jgi:hypothetical protein
VLRLHTRGHLIQSARVRAHCRGVEGRKTRSSEFSGPYDCVCGDRDPGLNFTDVLITEEGILIASLSILLFIR